MLIDIEKYSQVRLADVCKIFTSTSFLRVQNSETNSKKPQTFILCPNIYTPDKMKVGLIEANGFTKGFAVIPESCVNIVYLTSILNSAVSWATMTDGKLYERTSITLKRLSNVLVRLLPEKEQRAVAYLYYLLMDISEQKKEGSTNPYLDFWTSIYKEVQNAIALELMMPRAFKEYEIEMLTSWLALIGKCSYENQCIDMRHLQEILGKELLAPQNIVTGNMNKLRVVMKTIKEQATRKI